MLTTQHRKSWPSAKLRDGFSKQNSWDENQVKAVKRPEAIAGSSGVGSSIKDLTGSLTEEEKLGLEFGSAIKPVISPGQVILDIGSSSSSEEYEPGDYQLHKSDVSEHSESDNAPSLPRATDSEEELSAKNWEVRLLAAASGIREDETDKDQNVKQRIIKDLMKLSSSEINLLEKVLYDKGGKVNADEEVSKFCRARSIEEPYSTKSGDTSKRFRGQTSISLDHPLKDREPYLKLPSKKPFKCLKSKLRSRSKTFDETKEKLNKTSSNSHELPMDTLNPSSPVEKSHYSKSAPRKQTSLVSESVTLSPESLIKDDEDKLRKLGSRRQSEGQHRNRKSLPRQSLTIDYPDSKLSYSESSESPLSHSKGAARYSKDS